MANLNRSDNDSYYDEDNKFATKEVAVSEEETNKTGPNPNPTQNLKQQEQKKTWLENEFWDLRHKVKNCDPKETTHDCMECLGNPIVVILIFTVGLIIMCYGLWAMYEYMSGHTKNISKLWFVTMVLFLCITLTGIVIPYRFRFGYTLYGLLTFLLIFQYVVFLCAFPSAYPSPEQMEAVVLVSEFIKKQKKKLNKNTNTKK